MALKNHNFMKYSYIYFTYIYFAKNYKPSQEELRARGSGNDIQSIKNSILFGYSIGCLTSTSIHSFLNT